MDDILRDPVWQFAGAMLSATAILITVVIAWRQRRQKRLMYSIRVTELLSIGSEIREQIKIYYKGKIVPNVDLVEFTIRSTGNVPVLPAEFVKPVQLCFGEKSSVLSADIISVNPPDLGAEIKWSGSVVPSDNPASVIVEPVLLNPGDSVSIRCLVTGRREYLVAGRIAGVNRLERQGEGSRLRPSELILGVFIGVFLGSLAYLAWKGSLGGWELAAMGLVSLPFLDMLWRKWRISA